MKLRVQRSTISYLALVIALLIIANCNGNGDGGAGPSPNPVVSDFQIRPLTVQKAFTEVEYLISAIVTDPNDDLIGGRVEVNEPSTGDTVSNTIEADDFVGGRLTHVLVTNPVPAGRYDLVYSVVDAAGNRSNEIPFFVTITAQVPRGTTPGKMLDRLERVR